MGAEGGTRSRRTVHRSVVPLGLVGLLLIAMVVGGRLDDAPTDGRYRPALTPEPFGTICDPLPDGVVLDLPVQLRADRLLDTRGGPVRRLDLHYDLRDEAEVDFEVRAALRGAGFRPASPSTGADPAIEQWFERADYGRVGVAVTPFDVDDSSVVRGALTIDLPAFSLDQATRNACRDFAQTKRFPPGLDTYDED